MSAMKLVALGLAVFALCVALHVRSILGAFIAMGAIAVALT